MLLGKTTQKSLHELLLTIRDNPTDIMPRWHYYGICSLVELQIPAALWLPYKLELRKHFKTWELYSGNPEYPVPHLGEDPEEAYNRHSSIWTGSYGANRKHLLNHLIRETADAS